MEEKNKINIFIISEDSYIIRYLKNLYNQFNVISLKHFNIKYLVNISQLPNLIIIDYINNNYDTTNYCKEIKSNKMISDVPIIAIINEKSIIKTLYKNQVYDYIFKPFKLEEINARINTLLELVTTKSFINHLSNKITQIKSENNRISSLTAHEIRNPLKVIHGFSKLLEDKNSSLSHDEICDFVKDIRESTEIIMKIISNICDLNLIEEGKMSIMQEYVDLNNLMNIIINNFATAAYNKNINIIFDKISDNYTLISDFIILRQILSNILSNAIKFSSYNKSININISKNHKQIIISIQDEGPGIKENELPFIYEKFTKLSNIPTGYEYSTGLGLALSKALCELIQCQLICNSKVGKGTTFSLIIPINKQSQIN